MQTWTQHARQDLGAAEEALGIVGVYAQRCCAIGDRQAVIALQQRMRIPIVDARKTSSAPPLLTHQDRVLGRLGVTTCSKPRSLRNKHQLSTVHESAGASRCNIES